MKDKSLKDVAVDIKGKKYVLVADRILYFNEKYENGMITTSYIEDNDRITFHAVVTPDASLPERRFTGHSQATWGDGYINKTSALENAETSAVGRALAMMGIGVIESIASVDEIKKAQNTEKAIDNAPNCPDCGTPQRISKAGKAYCAKKYPLTNPACPPKKLTEENKKISDEIDNLPEPTWTIMQDDIPTITIDDIEKSNQ